MFDRHNQRVGFANPTEETSLWGEWGACSCSDSGVGMRTRVCRGLWCGEDEEGRASKPCKAKKCTTTTTRPVGKWGKWSNCSVPCGQGKQTRTCVTQGVACEGISTRGCEIRLCCPPTCSLGSASKTCDQVIVLSRILERPASCLTLEAGGCDCRGCHLCADAVASCAGPSRTWTANLAKCECVAGTQGVPVWQGDHWSDGCSPVDCPILDVGEGGSLQYSQPVGGWGYSVVNRWAKGWSY